MTFKSGCNDIQVPRGCLKSLYDDVELTEFSGAGDGMNNDNSSPMLTNCTFATNTVTGTGYGGGMYKPEFEIRGIACCIAIPVYPKISERNWYAYSFSMAGAGRQEFETIKMIFSKKYPGKELGIALV